MKTEKLPEINLTNKRVICRGCLCNLTPAFESLNWKNISFGKQNFWVAPCPDCNKKNYFWRDRKGEIHFENKLNFVLVNPTIIGNVGAILRLSCAFDATLHLIEPFGFIFDPKIIKRTSAGHFRLASKKVYHSWEDFLEQNSNIQLILTSSRAKKLIYEVDLKDYDRAVYFVFGNEAVGLSDSILNMKNAELLKIPQTNITSCLNLAQSVAIFGYQFLVSYNFFSV